MRSDLPAWAYALGIKAIFARRVLVMENGRLWACGFSRD